MNEKPLFHGIPVDEYLKNIDIHAKRLHLKGHKLSLEWSGEFGDESSSTGYCKCGWEETCGSQDSVRVEYRHHLKKEILSKHASALGYNSVSNLLTHGTDQELINLAEQYKPR